MSATTKRDGRRWTKEEILYALRRYVDEHGQAPLAEAWRANRPDGYPSYKAVARHFGTFTDGLRAAGVEARARGEWRVNELGHRPTVVRKRIVAWQRWCADRTVSPLEEARQKALLDPELRLLIESQLMDDTRGARAFPQLVTDSVRKPGHLQDFEAGVEISHDQWLPAVMDWRREIDGFAP